ncbi:hypothetical protein Tco_1564321 [Tanacetum coccineum]
MEEINNFQQEPDESLFRAWERFKELLMKCPQHYLTDMQEVILFYNGLDVPTRQILDSKGAIPTKTVADAKVAIQEMAEYSQKWHNRTSTKTKMNEKVYVAQVGCELCKGPHYTKDYPLKEEGKTLEEAYYTQFGAPNQPEGQYRVARPGFCQRNNRNSSYPNRRQTMEESLTKFIAESAKRHEENLNIIKKIHASTDTAIRNQGSSIKIMKIQIGHMSKVLQERGFGSLPSSTKTNPMDHVKLISTAKFDSTRIRRIRSGLYAVSDSQYSNIFSQIVPFPRRLHGYCCDDWKEAHEVKILETYDHTLPQKEKDPWSFTLPCFIHNVCFDKALVDLGASIDVFKRKITLRVREDKIVFKSIKLAASIIRRVYMLKEGTNLDSKTELIGEAINESFHSHYGNYIELNDLDVPLEPRMDQDNNFETTLDFVNEPTYKICYKMEFSCMIGYKHVNADLLPTLSVNMMTKRFYNSIIKDKGDHEGKKLAGTLIGIPIFVGNFSIISSFSIIDDMDITCGVMLGMPFCKKFVSCQKIMEKFAHGDECERMDEE